MGEAEAGAGQQLNLIIDRAAPRSVGRLRGQKAGENLAELITDATPAAGQSGGALPAAAIEMEVSRGMVLIPIQDADAGLILVTRIDDREGLVRGHQYAEERSLLRSVPRSGLEAVRVKQANGARVVEQCAIPGKPLRIASQGRAVAVERANQRVLVKVDVGSFRRILPSAVDVELKLDRAPRVEIGGIQLDAGRQETLTQFGVRQIELAVVLPGSRREQGVVRVIAVEDRGILHRRRAAWTCCAK